MIPASLSNGVDRATLTPVVRRALASSVAEVLDWQSSVVGGGYGNAFTASPYGIFRFTGTAREGGRIRPWSVILKASQVGTHDPDGPDYWRREMLAYQSGLLADLPGDLAAPRCLGGAETGPHETWLWLEDIGGTYGGSWPLPRFALAARHLGQLSGAYLADRLLPAYPWLSSSWLRRWLKMASEPLYNAYPTVRDHPLVRRAFGDGLGDRMIRLWEEREVFLRALDQLPQTLSHLDAFGSNLFSRCRPDGADETVAVDWAFVGLAGVGEELAPLVWASLFFNRLDLSRAQTLSESAFSAYVDGLRDSGWDGDERIPRLGYLAVSLVRYGLFPMPIYFAVLSDERRSALEASAGSSAEEILDRWVANSHAKLRLVDEARTLLPLAGRLAEDRRGRAMIWLADLRRAAA